MNGVKRRTARAFTLLEMMLVVVIIGLLATVAVINLTGTGDRAKVGIARTNLTTIKGQLSQYYIAVGSYPTSLLTLMPTYMDRIPKDPWTQEFVYYTPTSETGRPYTLVCKGPDKALNTTDDINVWTMDDEGH